MKAISSFLLTLSLIVAASAHAHSRDNFQADMRKLWEDHVTWTRLYIISAAAGLPDAKLTALLKDHILLAADLVGASKAGDAAKAADAKKKWYANANEIAAFLHGANPDHWPLATLQGAMKTHLDQTLDEATHRLHGDYAGDIKDYDAIVNQILMMADVLSGGIIKQFPKKFEKE